MPVFSCSIGFSGGDRPPRYEKLKRSSSLIHFMSFLNKAEVHFVL